MSSFWANMKKRRGSSNTNLTTSEIGKTPSGRSSVSKESKDDSRELKFDEHLKKDEQPRSSRVSRLAEQVLPRSGFRSVRLPPAFSKGFATGSLPRHLPSHSKTPPTQAPTAPEPQSGTKPPSTDSPGFLSKGFRKRSASASPPRDDETEKRKAFRGLSTDRFPTPLKNLLRARQAKSAPLEKLPPKPSRRPGPVGKAWVKVYDDIIYMDDPSAEELIPILGYTGFPTAIPEADPLPVAPTPPPQRLKQALDSESKTSVESEYDNVPKRQKTSDHESTEKESETKEDKENISPNVQLGRDTEKETDNLSKPSIATRPGRSREISRYKGKKQKRSGTPIGRDTPPSASEGEEEEPVPPPPPPIATAEENEEVMEDGYIIPQSLKPPKPPRGNKIYETVNKVTKEDTKDAEEVKKVEIPSTETKVEPPKPKRGIKIYESIIIKIRESESPTEEDHAKPFSDEKPQLPKKASQKEESKAKQQEFPPKPKRGIRIYETIQIGFRIDPDKEKRAKSEAIKETQEIKEDEETEEKRAKSEAIKETLKETQEIKEDEETEEKRAKSEAIKETQEIKEDEETEAKKEEDKEETSIEEESKTDDFGEKLPPKPSRGNKIYATVKTRPSKEERDFDSGESELQSDVLKANDNKELENDKETEDDAPVYAKVQKLPRPKEPNEDDKDNVFSLKEETEETSLPPLIPPKKKKLKITQQPHPEPVYDVLPCRPPRTLKPRPRSLDASPLRPKRQKTLPILRENGDSPRKPVRGAKLKFENNTLSMFEKEKATTLPLPRSKKKNKAPTIGDKDGSLPVKPLRHSQARLLPAPPRRKKLDKTGDEDQSTEMEIGPAPHEGDNLTKEGTKLSTENVIDKRVTERIAPISIKCKDRPPPPPPPKRNKLTAKKEEPEKTSLPKILSEENGDSEKESDAQQRESDSPTDRLTEETILCSLNETGNEIGYAVETESKLDVDIENNLKRIESSFETIDTVIQSLKKYASQGTLSENDKPVCSDESDNNVKQTDSKNRYEINNEINSEINVAKVKDLNLFKESVCGVSLDSEISDSETKSDVDTVIFVDKENSQNIPDLLTSTLSISDTQLLDDNIAISELLVDECHDSSFGEDIEAKPIEVTFVIKSDEPVTLPKPEDFQSNLSDEDRSENEAIVTSEIPLKLSTTEIVEFKFTPAQAESKPEESQSLITTEIPLKVSPTETSEFKFQPLEAESKPEESQSSVTTEPAGTETKTEEIQSVVTTEVLKTPSESSVAESKAEESQPEITAETFLKQTTAESLETKLELPQPENKAEESQSITSTEIPLKLSTTETTEFKFEASEPESKTDESQPGITADIPLNLPTTETSEPKLESSETETKTSEDQPQATEIPSAESTAESPEIKSEPSEVENKTDEGQLLISTEVPLQLSTTETSEFKFEPSETETKSEESHPIITEVPEHTIEPSEPEIKTEESQPGIAADIPLNLPTTERSEPKLESSEAKTSEDQPQATEIPSAESTAESPEIKSEPSKVENKTDEGQLLISTEVPLKLSTTEISDFKFEPSETETKSEESHPIITEVSEHTVEPSEPEIKTEESQPGITADIPLNLPTTETSEPKLESSETKTSEDQPQTTEVPSVESTAESPEIKSDPSAVENKTDEGQLLISTEVPLKLSTTETSEFKFEPSETETKSEESHPLITEVPEHTIEPSEPEIKTKESQLEITAEASLKQTSTESLNVEVEPSRPEKRTEDSQSITSTEIPLQLPTTETAEFKFEPLEPESKIEENKAVINTEVPEVTLNQCITETSETKTKSEIKTEESHPVITPEVPSKLFPTEIPEVKLESSKAETKPEDSQSVKTTEPQTTTEKLFEGECVTSSDLLQTEPALSSLASLAAEKVVVGIQKDSPSEQTPKATTPEPEDNKPDKLSPPVGIEPVSDQTVVSELASRLEGIRSQLDAIITNYPSSTSSSYSSLDTALSDISNRSSMSLDFAAAPESPLTFASVYSPNSDFSQSNHSSCSTPNTFYTAATPSEASFLSDSETNTPSIPSSDSSVKTDDDVDELMASLEKNLE